jgi:hypothetical protein
MYLWVFANILGTGDTVLPLKILPAHFCGNVDSNSLHLKGDHGDDE